MRLHEQSIELVPLEEIDREDRLTNYSFPPRDDGLRDSIAELGLITPLILQERLVGGRLRVVCGHRRARACRDVSAKMVRAYVWRESVTDLEALLFSIRENAFHRTWNEVEKGHILEAFSRVGVDDVSVGRDYMALVAVPPSRKLLARYRAIARLDERTKMFLALRKAPFAVAALMARLSVEDRTVLSSVADMLSMNMNRVRDVAVLLEEIGRREGCPFSRILAEVRAQAFLDDTGISPKERADRLRGELRRRRYPTLARWEARVARQLRMVRTPPGIVLRPPEGPEEEKVTVEFAIGSYDDFREKLVELDRMAGDDALRRLLALVREEV